MGLELRTPNDLDRTNLLSLFEDRNTWCLGQKKRTSRDVSAHAGTSLGIRHDYVANVDPACLQVGDLVCDILKILVKQAIVVPYLELSFSRAHSAFNVDVSRRVRSGIVDWRFAGPLSFEHSDEAVGGRIA